MPGFTANDSLYMTSGHYRSDRNHAINLLSQTINSIRPGATDLDMVGQEVIFVEGAAPTPWGLPSGWGPGGWGGPHGSGAPIPSGPGGGGGGGGRVPLDEGSTAKMEAACRNAANRCQVLNTLTKRCAVLRCKKNYCGPKHDSPKCTAAERDASREFAAAYDAPNCDEVPCILSGCGFAQLFSLSPQRRAELHRVLARLIARLIRFIECNVG